MLMSSPKAGHKGQPQGATTPWRNTLKSDVTRAHLNSWFGPDVVYSLLELQYLASTGNGEDWNQKAQYILDCMHSEGDGVVTDSRRSIDMFQKAAASGCMPAQFALGNIYQLGIGVPVNEAEALRFYSMGCSCRGCTST